MTGCLHPPHRQLLVGHRQDLSLLSGQEVNYELSNLSLVLREHLRSCGGVACAATDQWMALSSRSVEPSARALVGWRRSRGRSVRLGLSTVRPHIGGCVASRTSLTPTGWRAAKE